MRSVGLLFTVVYSTHGLEYEANVNGMHLIYKLKPDSHCFFTIHNEDGEYLDEIDYNLCCPEKEPIESKPKGFSSCFHAGSNYNYESCCNFTYAYGQNDQGGYFRLGYLPNHFLSRLEVPLGNQNISVFQEINMDPVTNMDVVLWGTQIGSWIADTNHFPDGYWKDKKVVEFGAGIGFPSLAAASLGADVLITDKSERSLEMAKAGLDHLSDANGDVQSFNVEEEWPDDLVEKFDVAICQNCWGGTGMANAVMRALKQDGILLMADIPFHVGRWTNVCLQKGLVGQEIFFANNRGYSHVGDQDWRHNTILVKLTKTNTPQEFIGWDEMYDLLQQHGMDVGDGS